MINYKRRKIEFISNGHRLFGFIDYPRKIPAPGIITFHGGSNNKDECPCFPQVPEALVKAGYVNMCFDYFGSGESDGDFQDKTNAELFQNTKDAIDFFIQDKNVVKIGVWGRSQSGLQLSYLVDGRITCRVLQAPAYGGFESVKVYYKKDFEEFLKHPEWKYMVIKKTDKRNVKGPYAYGRTFIEEFDEVDDLVRANAPKISHTLIMQGNNDDEVFPEQSWAAYNLMRGPKEYHIIDGASHKFDGQEDRVIDFTLYWFNKFLR